VVISNNTRKSHWPMTSNPPDTSPLPWADALYSIKRHGLSLTNCASEPVQTPGCIQAHGALLVLRMADLTILQASENTAQYLGEKPEDLLGQSAAKVVGARGITRLRVMLQQEPVERSTLYAFTLPARAGVAALDVCVHTTDGFVVVEFEPTGRTGEPKHNDIFSLVKASISRLQTAGSLRDFCQHVAREVRSITSLDRVMVYRFHADQHGEVFAENMREDLPAWLGLHYPEGDIPKPARDIFKRIWIRPLPNAAGPLVEIMPLANPDTGRPLNMTHCALRGASIMYTEYLANMGVAASLTMPILVDGELWGLIACHHYKPTHFSYQVRSACELLAQVTSLQLKAAEHSELLSYQLKLDNVHQQLVRKAASEGDLMALSDSQPSLLDAMDAEGAALFHLDRWWCAGKTPTEVQLDALAAWLDQRPEFDASMRPVFVTDALTRLYPAGAEMASVASGVLAVQISRLRKDLIMWFRPEAIQTVHWAGNPHDKPLVPGPNGQRLSPRGSFALFTESVKQRSRPWSPMEVESALRLQLLIIEMVVSRAERLAEVNLDLTRSNEELDAFAYVASHDLKEPLRGIHRYAHQLLESSQAQDAENRKRVESLMRLTERMDSLLDSLLHFSRVGRTNLEFQAVNLNEVVAEALEMIGVRRAENLCSIDLPRLLPTVLCDRVRVREIFSNLLSNAVKYTGQLCPHIVVGYLEPHEHGAPVLTPVEAGGQTIFYVRDDGIGIARQHFGQVFRMFKRLHGRDEFGGGVGAGLTIVEKLVQRHGGVVWLESNVGAGSTFYFTLPSAQGCSS
jgi:two-component system, chemotaxis family, sensor kinase Cph1